MPNPHKTKQLPIKDFVDLNYIYRVTENETILRSAHDWSVRMWKDIIAQGYYDHFLGAHLLSTRSERAKALLVAKNNLFDLIDTEFIRYEKNVLDPLELIATKSQMIKNEYLDPLYAPLPDKVKLKKKDQFSGTFLDRKSLRENYKDYALRKLSANAQRQRVCIQLALIEVTHLKSVPHMH